MARSRTNRLDIGPGVTLTRAEVNALTDAVVSPTSDRSSPASSEAPLSGLSGCSARERRKPLNEQLQLSFDDAPPLEANSTAHAPDESSLSSDLSEAPILETPNRGLPVNSSLASRAPSTPRVASRYRWSEARSHHSVGIEHHAPRSEFSLFARLRQWMVARSVGATTPAARTQLQQRARAFVNHTLELQREATRASPSAAISIEAADEGASTLLVSVGLIGAVLALAFFVV